jgi:hypothetical protein
MHFDHPAVGFIRSLVNEIDRSHFITSLNALARKRAIDLTFIAAPEKKISAVEYETRIVAEHELIVNDSLHDLFNACMWLTFPKTKRAISELHVSLGAGENNRRPRRRDVLTLFDESGLLLVCDRPLCSEFSALNAAHQWQTLFVQERQAFLTHVRPILFGHGALEQLTTQFHQGLTAKAVWFALPHDAAITTIDVQLANSILSDAVLRDDERRIPLPLLGVPGWFAENNDAQCYDDITIFRPAPRR